MTSLLKRIALNFRLFPSTGRRATVTVLKYVSFCCTGGASLAFFSCNSQLKFKKSQYFYVTF